MHKSRKNYKVQVKIFIDDTIQVITSLAFIMCGLWKKKKTKKFNSNLRKGKKIRSNEKEKEQIHEYYEITFHSLKKKYKIIIRSFANYFLYC